MNVRSFIPPNRRVDAVVGLSANGSTIDGWEWDVAAVDLIVREAGGCSTNPDGSPLCLNQPYPRLLDGFARSADPWTHERVLIALAAERMST